MRTILRSTVVTIVFVGLWTPIYGTARAYEPELRALGTGLLAKIEVTNQKSATVLDFTDLQGAPTELGRFLAQELSDQLVSAAKKISFVDRGNLQHLLRENKLSVEGLINPESSRKLGKLIGIDTLVFGTTTPIGNRIRLSVRVVNVETGKIVATEAANIPLTGGLGELYNRGVAPGTPGSTDTPRGDLRTILRSDTIKLTISELAVRRGEVIMTLTLENRSGIGLGAAVGRYATAVVSVGACTMLNTATGLAVFSEHDIGELRRQTNPAKSLRWFAAGSKILATMKLYCEASSFSGAKATHVTVNVLLATENEVLVLPLTLDAVAIRYVQN